MRHAAVLTLLCIFAVAPSHAQDEKGPTSEKARKSFHEGIEYLEKRNTWAALESFKKADRQDGGHCRACQERIVRFALQLQDWKAAETAASEMVDQAQEKRELALAHHLFGLVLSHEAALKDKQELFGRAHDEFAKALETYPNFPDAVFADGKALAHLKKEAEAKAQFERYIKMASESDPNRQRALLYISRPELAYARMAPPFSVTTIDDRRVSLDELRGNVVLIDFWATWCGPCRAALPRIRQFSKKFSGQPFVILSVSLDEDEAKWKDFVAKNEMTWLQYRDGDFKGEISTMFGVKAIPHTFTIDADGVLQDERIGDADIEGKLKKLIARAKELQSAKVQDPR